MGEPRSTCTARPATTSWKKCTFGSGCTGTPVRNLGLERVVRSILVDCSNAEYGCRTEKIAYCDRVEHELLRCHCAFAGKQAAELLEHLTGHDRWLSMAFRY
nr:unnamed protein product [Digitaria exilis]